MSIELQKIDANCTNCIFMVRDLDKRKQSLELHDKWQHEAFEFRKSKLLDVCNKHKANGRMDVYEVLIKEYQKMRYQFDKSSASIHYGFCSKMNKDVSFIPNICQIETQDCFVHRRDK
jgi:type II secretory ATPase GspE/PulE/Tfp pilus assembly ATPase PilB-like protein